MARTPLLRSIRNLVRDAKVSRATGVPLDDVREIRAENKALSRRKFLLGAAAGAGALALAPRGARANNNQKSVTIVGAGIAGVTCALKLRDHGFHSTVYEASTRIGGRMHSNTTYWSQGQVSEWCGELIDTGHTTIKKLAHRYNLTLDNLHDAEPAGSKEIYKFSGHYYPKADADADFLSIFQRVSDDADAAGYPTTYDSSTPRGRQLDHTSLYQYINQLVPGGHGAPLGKLLDTAYTIEFGAETTQQSALNLLYLLAFQPTDDQLDVFGESDETFHIRGGNQQLPVAIANDLCNQIVTGHSLVRIARTPNGRYRCTFDRGNGCVDVVSDYVVLAIPFAVLANIDTQDAGFDNLKKIAINELGRGHNSKTQLQFDARTWLGTGPWPGKSNGSSYSDAGYQASWEVTRAQAGSKGILVAYGGGANTDSFSTTVPFADASNARVVQDANRVLPQLRQVYPTLSWTGKATQSLPHKSPYLNLAYSYFKVGQYTRFAGYEGVNQGGVYFCGEHTSQDFQGFMEGGASTGIDVAKTLKSLL